MTDSAFLWRYVPVRRTGIFSRWRYVFSLVFLLCKDHKFIHLIIHVVWFNHTTINCSERVVTLLYSVDPSAAPPAPYIFRLAGVNSGWRAGAPLKIQTVKKEDNSCAQLRQNFKILSLADTAIKFG